MVQSLREADFQGLEPVSRDGLHRIVSGLPLDQKDDDAADMKARATGTAWNR